MPRLSKRERLRRERISRALLAYYRERRRLELLRRERISRALLAYYREQRRLQEARAEAARGYWRRVKQAAGRHQLTVPQARRAVRVADQQAIPVRTAARRIKRVPLVIAPPVPPPLPPVPPVPPPVPEAPPEERPSLPPPVPGEWRSPRAEWQEIAWNLRRRVDAGFTPDPLDFVPETGTLEGEFDAYVDGQYVRTERIQFESDLDPEKFWYNLHAAARELHETIMVEVEDVTYDEISITAMAIRMA